MVAETRPDYESQWAAITVTSRRVPGETALISEFAGLPMHRVGFRSGTHAELAALHAVEAPIQAERGSARMQQQLDAYVSFARNLPSQFGDHAWLVEGDDTPITCGYCWSNSAGDPRVMDCDVLVRRDHRRQGLGSRLLRAICIEAAGDGRRLLTWSTYGAASPGDAFSHRAGGRVARVNRTSELALSDVDWTMIENWTRAEPARGLGYRLEMVDGVFPERLRTDAATLHHIMQSAPREALDRGDVLVDADFVAQLDRALAAAGRTRWTIFMRDAEGACIGGTEVTFEASDPGTAFQQNTGIDPAHRGLGLAKWVKAAMLSRIRQQQPDATRVRTGNASSNAPMLAINDALGFQTISMHTEWQATPSMVERALDGRA